MDPLYLRKIKGINPNLQQFKKEYPDIDVHKNNPTILYIPSNVDSN